MQTPELPACALPLQTVDASAALARRDDPGAGGDAVLRDEVVARDDRRRFGGVERLYGGRALEVLAHSHACVVGVGGVGSWAAEALARSGLGRITLIDADHVVESNVNRQVHALDSTLGAAKIDVMRGRIADIAPRCAVRTVDDFITAGNVADLVPAGCFVIDAIDAPRAKAALVAWAVRCRQPIVVCGAAGGRTDPLRLRRADLARTTGDALLASVRARLRREYGFPRAGGGGFGVAALYSDERIEATTTAGAGAPLACAGYGSVVSVTGSMGFAAASLALSAILGSAT